MNAKILKLLKPALILAVVGLVSGCMATRPVYLRANGGYKVMKDNSPQGYHMGPDPKPAYAFLYLFTVPFDIATLPIQLPIFATAFQN
jgi:hypothetical protein